MDYSEYYFVTKTLTPYGGQNDEYYFSLTWKTSYQKEVLFLLKLFIISLPYKAMYYIFGEVKIKGVVLSIILVKSLKLRILRILTFFLK